MVIRHAPEVVMDEGQERGLRSLLAVVLIAIVGAGSLDLVFDAPNDWTSAHVLFELLMMATALAMATFVWAGWVRTRRAAQDYERRLAEGRAEREAWRTGAERALLGLGQAIAGQFAVWELTVAEQEVALRLLRGESHKAIAIDTTRSERTVRQHAGAVYRKAGVGSRAELAAFFLGGIGVPSVVSLPPVPDPTAGPDTRDPYRAP